MAAFEFLILENKERGLLEPARGGDEDYLEFVNRRMAPRGRTGTVGKILTEFLTLGQGHKTVTQLLRLGIGS